MQLFSGRVELAVLGSVENFLHLLTVQDLTGDGRPDILLSDPGTFGDPFDVGFAPLRLLVQQTSGEFVEADSSSVLEPFPDMADPRVLSGDVNGDGIDDLLISDVPGKPIIDGAIGGGNINLPGWLIRSGPNGFETVPLNDIEMSVGGWALGDVDGDGDLDLAVDQSSGIVPNDSSSSVGAGIILFNDGSGFFSLKPGVSFVGPEINYDENGVLTSGRVSEAALGDFDGDGNLDVAFGIDRALPDAFEEGFIFINDGSGSFPIEGRFELPLPAVEDGDAETKAMSAGDLNGDGLDDLVLSTTPIGPSAFAVGAHARFVQILISNGNGTFRDETLERIGSQTLESAPLVNGEPNFSRNELGRNILVDVNGDGAPDIVTASIGPLTASNPYYYINNGRGFFDPLPLESQQLLTDFDSSAIRADVNGDGLADHVAAYGNVVEVAYGSAPILQPSGITRADGQRVARLYEAGLDRDGEIDLPGLNFWIDVLEGGTDIRSIAGAFLDSDEFQGKAEAFLSDGTDLTDANVRDSLVFSNDDFVAYLYENVLDREFDVPGRDFWVSVLEQFESNPQTAQQARERLLLAFADSDENVEGSPLIESLNEIARGEWGYV